jgi:hypothetical protein
MRIRRAKEKRRAPVTSSRSCHFVRVVAGRVRCRVGLGHTDNESRYGYGGGTRIALGEALVLVARIDVGFSDEEKGLVYVVFGYTF